MAIPISLASYKLKLPKTSLMYSMYSTFTTVIIVPANLDSISFRLSSHATLCRNQPPRECQAIDSREPCKPGIVWRLTLLSTGNISIVRRLSMVSTHLIELLADFHIHKHQPVEPFCQHGSSRITRNRACKDSSSRSIYSTRPISSFGFQ